MSINLYPWTVYPSMVKKRKARYRILNPEQFMVLLKPVHFHGAFKKKRKKGCLCFSITFYYFSFSFNIQKFLACYLLLV